MTNLKLTKQQQEFLKKVSLSVSAHQDGVWYYIPFWFNKQSDGSYNMMFFNDLPETVKQATNNKNNGNN